MIVPVLLCGGSGTRLWPVSTPAQPKQFLKHGPTGTTLFQQTLLRAMRATGMPAVLVTQAEFKDEIIKQTKLLPIKTLYDFITEPEPRNTAPAIALAALHAQRVYGPDRLLLILPSDHLMAADADLAPVIAIATPHAQEGRLVTFGIRPTRAETGFGYIARGQALPDGQSYLIDKFKEKPEKQLAETYLASGSYDWNSGMLLARADAILAALERFAPDILAPLAALPDPTRPDAQTYASMPSRSFDIAVLEHADTGVVVPCALEWDDAGSWASLWKKTEKDGNKNAVQGDTTATVIEDCSGCYIDTDHSGTTLCIGLEDIVVVRRGDSLLVTKRDVNGDTLRRAIERLNGQNQNSR